MIKNILKFQGVEQLSRKQKSTVYGGVDKCCLIIPPHGITEEEGGKRHNCDQPGCVNARCCKDRQQG